MKLAITLIALLYAVTARAEWLGDWLKENEPRVIEYVQSLTPSDAILKGVKLSSGEMYLEGFVYLSKAKTNRPGTHIHVFKNDEWTKALIWLESNSEPLELPTCTPGTVESTFPGFKGSVLSGDVYTYKSVTPENRIIVTYCPKPSWYRGSDA